MSGKVTFDGSQSLISINDGETEIDVKADFYSSWKNWLMIDDNAKYLPAFRVSGGDPLGGGLFSGDIYFLVNGWRVEISHNCSINGVLYSDDYPSPYVAASGTNIVTNRVSSLVQTVATGGGSGSGPTAVQIRQEMDNNSTKLASINSTVGQHTNKLNEINTTVNSSNAAIAQIPALVRDELAPELAHVMTLQNGAGLNTPQATMLLEIYRLYGLDPTAPLIVSNVTRTAGDINQSIVVNTGQTVITRT